MANPTPFVPVGNDHALRHVILGVGFNDPLTPAALEVFRTPGLLQEELPAHVVFEGQMVSLRIGPGNNINPATPLGGMGIGRVEFQRFSNGGVLEWQLGIERERVYVSCHAYTRWRDVAERSFGFLDKVFRALQPHRATANSVVCEVVDEFFGLEDASAGYRSLFRHDCRWIAPQSLDSIGFFHNNVGWFEQPDAATKRLVRLNIEALPVENFDKVPAGSLSGVRINTFLRTDPTLRAFPLAIAPGSEIRAAFEAMHHRNKELIVGMLTDDMNKRIGLA